MQALLCMSLHAHVYYQLTCKHCYAGYQQQILLLKDQIKTNKFAKENCDAETKLLEMELEEYNKVCICVCICVYMCMYMCVYVCVYVCICVCICVHIHVFVCVCMCIYLFMCVFTCMYACEYILQNVFCVCLCTFA
jgi:hypothetical protein